jgi:hypothetical protein
MKNGNDRPRIQWEDDKTFENDTHVVQVSKLPLRNPKFSISISGKNRDGKPVRFMPVYGDGQGTIVVRPVLADLRELLDSAEAHIQRQLQWAEDERIEADQQRAARDKGRDQKRPGLKELSKRDARRHEKNPSDPT